VDEEPTGVRSYHSERDSHERGLARAVLSKESVNGSGSNGEAGSV
jgi:hypothetical protein